MTDFSIIKNLFGFKEICGYSPEELMYWSDTYEEIPETLKDYYLELGKCKKLNDAQDFLLKPSQFSEYYNENYLVFYSENQGGCLWGIKREDLKQKNPPVYESYDEEEWFLTADSVYDFLVSMAHMQYVFSGEYTQEEYINITPAIKEKIDKTFILKNINENLYTGVWFYTDSDDDMLIMVMKNSEEYILMYAADNENSFKKVDSTIDSLLERWI